MKNVAYFWARFICLSPAICHLGEIRIYKYMYVNIIMEHGVWQHCNLSPTITPKKTQCLHPLEAFNSTSNRHKQIPQTNALVPFLSIRGYCAFVVIAVVVGLVGVFWCFAKCSTRSSSIVGSRHLHPLLARAAGSLPQRGRHLPFVRFMTATLDTEQSLSCSDNLKVYLHI